MKAKELAALLLKTPDLEVIGKSNETPYLLVPLAVEYGTHHDGDDSSEVAVIDFDIDDGDLE
jgi:hypothetical protein